KVQHPYVSPLYGHLEGLPPLLLQVGTAEVLLDDSLSFAKKARKAGNDIKLEIWDDMPHVWQFFWPIIPEAEEALNSIAAFVRQKMTILAN
ncbi:MAG TPA: alpha/beta hydrolase, partial [Chitinophagales bacterium]|nr:alpha/beta hydrolase [Chitinophagales bacterium]